MTKLQGRTHAGAGSVRSDIVVELRERGQDTFHQLAGGGVIDWFGRGAEGDDGAADKPKAVRDIFFLTDFPAFLKASGYNERFER